jgi:hypothetical protein
MTKIRSGISFVVLVCFVLAVPVSAWNIPRHMLSAAIAYQVLQQENPPTIDKVKAVLEKHPWYTNQWQARLQDVPATDHGLVLFIQAARWPLSRGPTGKRENQRARPGQHSNRALEFRK